MSGKASLHSMMLKQPKYKEVCQYKDVKMELLSSESSMRKVYHLTLEAVSSIAGSAELAAFTAVAVEVQPPSSFASRGHCHFGTHLPLLACLRRACWRESSDLCSHSVAPIRSQVLSPLQLGACSSFPYPSHQPIFDHR